MKRAWHLMWRLRECSALLWLSSFLIEDKRVKAAKKRFVFESDGFQPSLQVPQVSGSILPVPSVASEFQVSTCSFKSLKISSITSWVTFSCCLVLVEQRQASQGVVLWCIRGTKFPSKWSSWPNPSWKCKYISLSPLPHTAGGVRNLLNAPCTVQC